MTTTGWSRKLKIMVGIVAVIVLAGEAAYAVFLGKTIGGTVAPQIWSGSNILLGEVFILVYMVRALIMGRRSDRARERERAT